MRKLPRHLPRGFQGASGLVGALELEVSATLVCGDDYFGEHEQEALAKLLGWLKEERPDVLICGTGFRFRAVRLRVRLPSPARLLA